MTRNSNLDRAPLLCTAVDSTPVHVCTVNAVLPLSSIYRSINTIITVFDAEQQGPHEAFPPRSNINIVCAWSTCMHDKL